MDQAATSKNRLLYYCENVPNNLKKSHFGTFWGVRPQGCPEPALGHEKLQPMTKHTTHMEVVEAFPLPLIRHKSWGMESVPKIIIQVS